MPRLAAISLTATADKAANVETAISMIREAARRGADWVQLPEIFAYHGPYDTIYDAAEEEGGPLFQKLSALARELGIVLFAGTVGERPSEDLPESVAVNAKGERRVYNTAYVFGRDGSLLCKYRKTHLFNLYDSEGRPSYCESDGFIPGDETARFRVDDLEVGLAVCYDLRFPEFFARLVGEKPVDVLAIPSAFTLGTGRAHWELLLRARAVEWQCYVYAANQVGEHSPGKSSFGHSMIVDPWGELLASTGMTPGIAIAELDPARIAEVRGRLPALKNRRPELYD